ncbi:MAG: hypothetical protein RhofKO_37040 [Rhodothermales bacterium]
MAAPHMSPVRQLLFFAAVVSLGLCSVDLVAAQPFAINEHGYVLIEAENLPHSDQWTFHEHKNARGRGYLKYVGPVTGSGHDQETDQNGVLQGREADWIVVPVQIRTPGRYRVNIRNHHMHKDGDNDIWVHIKGWPLPVRRVGDHAVDSFQWLTWGPDWVYWDIDEPGVYEFYVAGRSHGFGVDRVAVYNESAPITMYHSKQESANQ